MYKTMTMRKHGSFSYRVEFCGKVVAGGDGCSTRAEAERAADKAKREHAARK